MEQDLYAAGYAAGVAFERAKRAAWLDEGAGKYRASIQDILCEVSDFLDNYTDAEWIDGHIVGNRAMNLKASVDELIG